MVKVESQQNARKERQNEMNTYLPNRRRLFRVTPPTVRQNDCASFEDWLRGLRVLSPYRWRVISNPLDANCMVCGWITNYPTPLRQCIHIIVSQPHPCKIMVEPAEVIHTGTRVANFAHIRTKLWPVTSTRGFSSHFLSYSLQFVHHGKDRP